MASQYRSLADYLARTGIKQKRVAERLGISMSHLSMIKRGQRVPRLPLAVRISETLNIRIEGLLRKAA